MESGSLHARFVQPPLHPLTQAQPITKSNGFYLRLGINYLRSYENTASHTSQVLRWRLCDVTGFSWLNTTTLAFFRRYFLLDNTIIQVVTHNGKTKRSTNFQPVTAITATRPCRGIRWRNRWHRAWSIETIRKVFQWPRCIYHRSIGRKGVPYYRYSQSSQPNGHFQLHRSANIPHPRSRSRLRRDQEIDNSRRYSLYEPRVSDICRKKRSAFLKCDMNGI